MWLTPSSTARRSTRRACSRSRGTASGISAGPVCGRRIAPKPIRWTVRSPSFQVPEAEAVTVVTVVSEVMSVMIASGLT